MGQRGQHEDDPDGRRAEPPPGGYPRGHAAAQPVGRVAAQRAAVTGVPLTQPERTVAPERATVPRLVAVPAVRMLHASIMAPATP